MITSPLDKGTLRPYLAAQARRDAAALVHALGREGAELVAARTLNSFGARAQRGHARMKWHDESKAAVGDTAGRQDAENKMAYWHAIWMLTREWVSLSGIQGGENGE